MKVSAKNYTWKVNAGKSFWNVASLLTIDTYDSVALTVTVHWFIDVGLVSENVEQRAPVYVCCGRQLCASVQSLDISHHHRNVSIFIVRIDSTRLLVIAVLSPLGVEVRSFILGRGHMGVWSISCPPVLVEFSIGLRDCRMWMWYDWPTPFSCPRQFGSSCVRCFLNVARTYGTYSRDALIA